jgi:hypothetical protein
MVLNDNISNKIMTRFILFINYDIIFLFDSILESYSIDSRALD